MLPRAGFARVRRAGVTLASGPGRAVKTPASMLAAAVLETAGRTRPPRQENRLEYVMAAGLATQPSDDFCVVELGAGRSGWERSLATVRPRIGVVTAVGMDALKVPHSIAAIAQEKAKLIACLPKDGTAVLNADDARVPASADQKRKRLNSSHSAAQVLRS